MVALRLPFVGLLIAACGRWRLVEEGECGASVPGLSNCPSVLDPKIAEALVDR